MLCASVASSRSTWCCFPNISVRELPWRARASLASGSVRSDVLFYREVRAHYPRTFTSKRPSNTLSHTDELPQIALGFTRSHRWIAVLVNITAGTPARRRLSELASRFRAIRERELWLTSVGSSCQRPQRAPNNRKEWPSTNKTHPTAFFHPRCGNGAALAGCVGLFWLIKGKLRPAGISLATEGNVASQEYVIRTERDAARRSEW